MVPRMIVIGASAGGISVLREVLAGLSSGFPAIICVVIHIPAWRKNLLPTLLRIDDHQAVNPVNRQRLALGRVYVAPPDHHLMIDDGEALLWHGPKENSHRPAINALFRSAAITHGPQV